jgi:hypothetical protein
VSVNKEDNYAASAQAKFQMAVVARCDNYRNGDDWYDE